MAHFSSRGGRAKPEGDHNALFIHPVTYSFETNLMMMELIAAMHPRGCT
jgi:hypothetical protein